MIEKIYKTINFISALEVETPGPIEIIIPVTKEKNREIGLQFKESAILHAKESDKENIKNTKFPDEIKGLTVNPKATGLVKDEIRIAFKIVEKPKVIRIVE